MKEGGGGDGSGGLFVECDDTVAYDSVGCYGKHPLEAVWHGLTGTLPRVFDWGIELWSFHYHLPLVLLQHRLRHSEKLLRNVVLEFATFPELV